MKRRLGLILTDGEAVSARGKGVAVQAASSTEAARMARRLFIARIVERAGDRCKGSWPVPEERGSLQRNAFQAILHVFWIKYLGEQLNVSDGLPDGDTHLTGVYHAGELAA